MLLARNRTSDRGTPGSLILADWRTFRTIELPWRDNREDVSCIITGVFPLWVIERTKKFPYPHIGVGDVPGRSGVRIHRANRPSQLLGCVAPGLAPYGFRTEDGVASSTDALERIVDAVRKGDDVLRVAWRGDLKPPGQ